MVSGDVCWIRTMPEYTFSKLDAMTRVDISLTSQRSCSRGLNPNK